MSKVVRKKVSYDLIEQLKMVLKTLEQSDGPDLKECNRILDEMESFTN